MEAAMVLMAMPWLAILFVEGLLLLSERFFNPPRKFKSGHIRAYDTSGEYVYADQNPNYRRY